ncbi:MAG: nitroreductase family protein [Deltaproteobacteria bacterium]|nr:nitroreductase family protein [Candidatus Zymogenaceae bacterium]
MILENLVNVLTEAESFTKEDVSDGEIMAVLEAARLAPSAMNSQIWRFFVIRGRNMLESLAKLAGKPAFGTCPVIIAACASPSYLKRRGREQPYFMIDVPIAVSHLLLSAAELGLGCSWTYEFDEQDTLSIIEAPKRYRVVALVALGHMQQGNRAADIDEWCAVEIR